MKYRSFCTCHCHNPGMNVKHMVACCKPDPTYCDKTLHTRPFWYHGVMRFCVCALAVEHIGDCMCIHDLDDAA